MGGAGDRPEDPREIAELRTSDHYRYFGVIGLTVITGGTWLIARRWWRRKPRHKTPWIIAAVLVYVLILVLGRFLP